MNHGPTCCVPDLYRRRLISATLAAGGLLLIPTPSWAGGVRELQGEVSISGRKASKKSTVSPGDTVTTGAGARIAFLVGNDAYLVKENSHLELAGKRRDAVASVLRDDLIALEKLAGRVPPFLPLKA